MNVPRVLFSDARYVIIDKPAGLPVHAGRAGGASVEDWFPLLSRRRDGPWLAHRLDADTAGCLLIALRKAALVEAQSLFASGRVDKLYWAVVEGAVAAAEGRIDVALSREESGRRWRMAPASDGEAAVTLWRKLGETGEATWLALRPLTGRTHQIRAHCAAIGHPIQGDEVYGARGPGSLHLLARSLALPLSPPVAAIAEPPPVMRERFAACGWPGPGRAFPGAA